MLLLPSSHISNAVLLTHKSVVVSTFFIVFVPQSQTCYTCSHLMCFQCVTHLVNQSRVVHILAYTLEIHKIWENTEYLKISIAALYLRASDIQFRNGLNKSPFFFSRPIGRWKNIFFLPKAFWYNYTRVLFVYFTYEERKNSALSNISIKYINEWTYFL